MVGCNSFPPPQSQHSNQPTTPHSLYHVIYGHGSPDIGGIYSTTTTTMENAVKNLEAMFQKADSGINNLTQRLSNELDCNDEAETNPAELLQSLNDAKAEYASLVQEAAAIEQATKFQKADSGINNLTQRLSNELDCNDEAETNPAELLQSLNDAKAEYASLVQEAAAIEQATKDVTKEFQGSLNEVLQLLMSLQAGGVQLKEKPEELVRLEGLLGSSLPWGPESHDQEPEEAEDGAPSPKASSSCPTPSSQASAQQSYTRETEHSPGECSVMSPASQRRTSSECVEVSEEEFNSVSELVRGRVKLQDVNSVYKSLWDYFKTAKGKGDTLSTADMQKMGMKVTGVTGQAKLKVLRALKLLKISTKGDVSMP